MPPGDGKSVFPNRASGLQHGVVSARRDQSGASGGGIGGNDGAAAVMAMNHFTPGAPVEIFESEYPLRVRAFELIRDSAGAGRFRGGLGYAREFEVLEDSVLTVRS